MESTLNRRRPVGYVALALAVTIPGVAIRIAGAHPPEILAAALFGLAIVGAAFMLSWAAEIVQLDISAGPGIAVRDFPLTTGGADYLLYADGIRSLSYFEQMNGRGWPGSP